MALTMTIKVFDIVGKNCITQDAGEKVYELLHPQFKNQKSVELDFSGVEIFASPFFNIAIGRLLKDISADDLDRLLKVTNIKKVGEDVIKVVISNSSQYYNDATFRNNLNRILSEQEEDI